MTKADNDDTPIDDIGLDLDRLRTVVDRCNWAFAKTMPHMPHEYTIAGRSATRHDINYLAKAIRDHGYKAKFGKHTGTYLAVDGWKYWGWGNLINRAELKHDTPEQQMARETWETMIGAA